MISASGDPGSTLWSYSQRAPSGIDIRIDSIRPPVLSPATPECWLPSVSPSHKSRLTPSHVSGILKPIDSKPLRSRLRDQSYRDAGLYTGYRPASPHLAFLLVARCGARHTAIQADLAIAMARLDGDPSMQGCMHACSAPRPGTNRSRTGYPIPYSRTAQAESPSGANRLRECAAR